MNQNIRIIALGLIRNGNKFLFDQMNDPAKNLCFLRPIGGGIEFAETSEQAMIREVKEEINSKVSHLNLLGNFENIFMFNNQPKHEIVYLYDIKLADKALYEMDNIPVKEQSNNRVAKWVAHENFDKYTIYPPQILQFINFE